MSNLSFINKLLPLIFFSLLLGCDRENDVIVLSETPEVVVPEETNFVPDHVNWAENNYAITAAMGKATRCLYTLTDGTEYTEYILETADEDFPDTVFLDEVSEVFISLDEDFPEFSTFDIVVRYEGAISYAIDDDVEWRFTENSPDLISGTFSGSFQVEDAEGIFVPLGVLSGNFHLPVITINCN